MTIYLNNVPLFLFLFFFSVCNPPAHPPVTLPADLEALGKIVNTHPDSVQNRLKGIADTLLLSNAAEKDAASCKVLFLYAKALFISGEIDQSFDYSQKGKYYARHAKVPLYEAKFTGQMGYKYLVNARYDSASICFAESMRLFASVPDSSEYYKSAINWANSELKVRGNTPNACHIIRKAVDYYQKNGPPNALAMGLSNLAQCYGELKMQDSARYYFSLVEPSMHLLPVSQKPQLLLNIGIIAEEDGDYEKALKYYQAAEDLKEVNPRIAALVTLNRGVLLHKLGKMAEAERRLKAALALLPDDSTFIDIRQMAYRELSDLYSDQKRWEEAFVFKQKHEALEATITGIKAQENLNKLHEEYNVKEHLATINRQRNVITFHNIALGILLVLSILGLGYILLNRQIAQETTPQPAEKAIPVPEEALLFQSLTASSFMQQGYPDADLDAMITLSNREKTQIRAGDILYISAAVGGVHYHTSNNTYFCWKSLRSCLKELPAGYFAQISKNAIVAKGEIVRKTSSSVLLRSGIELMLGPTYQNNLKDLV